MLLGVLMWVLMGMLLEVMLVPKQLMELDSNRISVRICLA